MSLFRQNIDRAFRSHRWLWAACGVYLGAWLIESLIVKAPASDIIAAVIIAFIMTGVFAKICAGVFLLIGSGRAVVQRGRGEAWRDIRRGWKDYFCSDRFARGVSAFCLVSAILFFIGAHKSLFPYFNPFHWDPALARWDAFLHFGHQPYQLLTPLVEYFGVTGSKFVAGVYVAWFPVMYVTCFHAAFIDRDTARVTRFLWTFLLSWAVLGVAAAMALTSVGPMYYHDFYPHLPDPFKPLVDDLYPSLVASKVPFIFETRELLLKWVRDAHVINFNSLSAMPSLHVGMAWLFLLYWRTVSRALFALAAAFFLLILVGSVYLGFHYAIDGYATVAGVSILWRSVARGKLLFFNDNLSKTLAPEIN